MSRLKGRLNRLELATGAADPPRPDPTLLDVARLAVDPTSFDPADRERVEIFWQAWSDAVARSHETSTAAKLYREELVRRGLPQPESLAGIDPFEELMRLR